VSYSNTEAAASAEREHALVLMPQMGVSVAEGTLALWHKREGDWVERDETVCEVSSDKIDTEVPSPAAGRIEELLVAEGETVAVGTPLARIAGDAEPGQPHPAEGDAVPTRPDPAEGDAEAAPPRRAVISPVVQRIASEHGLDLAGVSGSGRGGRIRKQDVLALVRAAHEGEPRAERGEPLSRMRRAIAEHMTRSLQTAATCTTITEADFARVERERERVGCSPLALVASATVQALRRHPDLNATLEGEVLTRHEDVNLGIAVSLGEEGLIVPVIARAQELSVEGLAERIRELARRARAKELTPEEVRGGTFTITNPGGFGSIASTPIINQPQVAILDLEAIVRRAVVIADEEGMEAIAIRPMANLCLSWDHRALDGALAAQFLATLRLLIEKGSER
jgi:pyruvate/2-oxoglutarate dehydrogenase complex dihydrolipoamide acyltransferase (E2) component